MSVMTRHTALISVVSVVGRRGWRFLKKMESSRALITLSTGKWVVLGHGPSESLRGVATLDSRARVLARLMIP